MCWYVVFSINIIKLQITTHVTEQQVVSARMDFWRKIWENIIMSIFHCIM
jgi:uncharacterized membrane protein YvlD (DUF360 family)